MSFAPPATRARANEDTPRVRAVHSPAATELGDDWDDTDWGRISAFGLGVLVGALVGSGTALLMAPQSGEEARSAISRGARNMGGRAGDMWEDLRDELDWAARRGQRKLSRSVTRGSWAAEDLLARSRRRAGL
jgi:gas vesicle protein